VTEVPRKGETKEGANELVTPETEVAASSIKRKTTCAEGAHEETRTRRLGYEKGDDRGNIA
jgi:hypothetical protein